jgi:antitoxin ParD1/3/4
MPTKNVNLSAQQTKFIAKSVHGGRYRNASEVVRAGLRLLEQNEREDKLKLEALRQIATQAFDDIDQGQCQEIAPGDLDYFMAKVDSKVRNARKR